MKAKILPVPNYTYRVFYRNSINIAEIVLYIVNDHTIELQVMGLHDNEPIDTPCNQATVVVEYPPNASRYDVIMLILNKITKDHDYYLRDNYTHVDKILCSMNL
jgi:hypothetical protein